MSRTAITTARSVALRVRPNHRLVAGLAAVAIAAAGGGAIAFSGDDPVAPTKPNGAPATPIIFGDPPILKGARGGKTNAVTLRVFRDPTVRKGAGGRAGVTPIGHLARTARSSP
jgi:hypothetical protein